MILFKSNSGIYTLEVRHFLNISLDDAWDFFTSPGNLSKITPEYMGFKITSGATAKMYPGQIITYKVSPLPGIKTNWVTEITHVAEGSFFVDEQRFGPYRMWHHEHHFEVQGEGVLLTDRVSYKLPFGFIGRIAHFFFVRNQLKQIFLFRTESLEKMHGKSQA
ncbi:MAG TPA: SRPBCC family protein [Prolixibacteraceae bacterium]|nr:SRPBCC family protein [Prolixibacteraceae bacterium]